MKLSVLTDGIYAENPASYMEELLQLIAEIGKVSRYKIHK